MIKPIVASILVGFGTMALAQGVIVEPGKDYVFEFTSIPYLRPAQFKEGSQIVAWFAPGTLSLNESSQLEVFANNLSDVPTVSYITIDEYPSGRAGVVASWGYNSPPFFSDFQGVLRVTMLSGSAELSGFDVSSAINGGFYSGYFAVPEPQIGCLCAEALGGLLFLRKWMSGSKRVRTELGRREQVRHNI